jgi:hypothetical protein
MRLGQNPAKSIEQVAQPQRITVAVVTYIPFTHGYYAQSLDILKYCLSSIWEHTELPYDLLVFDNASCPEVRAYLQEAHTQGKIQFLVLSERNIGKSGAWNFIFSAAPGEIVAYADSDIYFYPGWLSALVHILESVPNVGMVTGMPLLNPETYFTSTRTWAEATPEASLEHGRLLPWEDYWRHAGTLGSDESKARVFYDQHESYRLTLRGEQYYLGAGHFQFVAPRAALQAALPLPSQRPMGQVRALDETLNHLGYLRLSTPQWWVQHLGNNLEGWQPLFGSLPPHSAVQSPKASQQAGGFWAWKPVRTVLLRLYDHIFRILYKS